MNTKQKEMLREFYNLVGDGKKPKLISYSKYAK